MKHAQAQVREFMLKAGQECPDKPTIPELDICHLRHRLIQEENEELKDALIAGDVVAVADAVGDLLYVVLGAAVAFGIEIEPVFQEIHRSNQSKFIDGHRRADGKWVKGPSYSPANLAPIIAEQRSESSETKWKSCAIWPFVEGWDVNTNTSEDIHDTEEQAVAVCEMLKREGLGGHGRIFPIRVWVEPTKMASGGLTT